MQGKSRISKQTPKLFLSIYSPPISSSALYGKETLSLAIPRVPFIPSTCECVSGRGWTSSAYLSPPAQESAAHPQAGNATAAKPRLLRQPGTFDGVQARKNQPAKLSARSTDAEGRKGSLCPLLQIQLQYCNSVSFNLSDQFDCYFVYCFHQQVWELD